MSPPQPIRWVLITRPAPDAEALAADVQALGFKSVLSPVTEIVWRGRAPDLSGMAGFVFTSANGVRALVHHLRILAPAVANLPVYAVGSATAGAARAAGFTGITEATGDVAALAHTIRHDSTTRGPGPLLHVAGTHLAGDLAALLADGPPLERRVLYEARPCPDLTPAAQDLLQTDPSAVAIPLFSPRSARLLADQMHRAALAPALQSVIPICLSEAVAESARAAGFSPAHIRVAAHPRTDALCALLTPQS
ncbi:MAG: uroporphyrinogen-III synthase [Pseudomonadota bacterium]